MFARTCGFKSRLAHQMRNPRTSVRGFCFVQAGFVLSGRCGHRPLLPPLSKPRSSSGREIVSGMVLYFIFHVSLFILRFDAGMVLYFTFHALLFTFRFSFFIENAKTPLNICSREFCLVPVAGLEPARCHHRWILSPLRLPIPSHRHIDRSCLLKQYNTAPWENARFFLRKTKVFFGRFLGRGIRSKMSQSFCEK